VRQLSVLAFQKLWNLNNPNNKLTEDGAYGSKTENAILSYTAPPTHDRALDRCRAVHLSYPSLSLSLFSTRSPVSGFAKTNC
jgi:hypothetical protein